MSTENNVKKIHQFGQSIWLDFIDRKIMRTGALDKLIQEDGIRGVTSNPAIFEKAISSGSDYNEDMQTFSKHTSNEEEIFFRMAVADIQAAADLFKPIYEGGEVRGADGYVSLEVSPRLAKNTEGTIEQARTLWKELARENVMIKIPGTAEGLPAIRTSIAEGINVNVTLLFDLVQYKQVVEAYISGLEERAENNLPLESISSVASFFISRVDVAVDPKLEEKGLSAYKSQVAIAMAKQAYQYYKEIFSDERFQALKQKGAKPQRLLWASTGTKNPDIKDTIYIESLIGPDTVNTVPLETLEAMRDHGHAASMLESDLEGALDLIKKVGEAGINLEEIAAKLQEEGVEKFNQPYEKLIGSIRAQINN